MIFTSFFFSSRFLFAWIYSFVPFFLIYFVGTINRSTSGARVKVFQMYDLIASFVPGHPLILWFGGCARSLQLQLKFIKIQLQNSSSGCRRPFWPLVRHHIVHHQQNRTVQNLTSWTPGVLLNRRLKQKFVREKNFLWKKFCQKKILGFCLGLNFVSDYMPQLYIRMQSFNSFFLLSIFRWRRRSLQWTSRHNHT